MRRFCLSVFLFFSIAFIAVAQNTISLDEAIDTAGQDIFNKFSSGTRIAIININCESSDMSTYIIDKLTEKLVNETTLVIAERSTAAINAVNQELNLQYSGDVSDETAVGMGKKWGAQAIINGSFKKIGKTYQLTIKSVDVETSTIKVQKSLLVANSEIIADLMDTTYVPTTTDTRTVTTNQNKATTTPSTSSNQKTTATTKKSAPINIATLIKKDLYGNSEIIQNATRNFSSEQRYDIYSKHKKGTAGAFALNFFLGYGIGSFVQGDLSGGFCILTGALLSSGLIGLGSSTGSTTLLLTGVGCSIGFGIYGWVRPFTYAKNFNNKLAESLNLYDLVTYATPVFTSGFDKPQLALGAKIRL